MLKRALIVLSLSFCLFSAIYFAQTTAKQEAVAFDGTFILQDKDEAENADAIDLNSATSEELQTIKGVGPVMAEKILTYRSEQGGFMFPEELLLISGIGEKTFERIKPFVTVK